MNYELMIDIRRVLERLATEEQRANLARGIDGLKRYYMRDLLARLDAAIEEECKGGYDFETGKPVR